MPKIIYIDKKFQKKSLAIIETANEIINEYQDQGYDMTLRQLYYQFVARDYLPNTTKSYTLLASIISKARLAGYIDWDAIVDRTRNPKQVSHWDNPAEIIEACATSYRIDTRSDQPYHIEVWVEKEALAGVIEKTCNRLDILSFACRGYVSKSAMWRASLRIIAQETIGKETIILHLGDHDPSGVDMTRDIENYLHLFGAKVEVNRIALNMDQIEEYSPPPNPVKEKDTRSGSYIAEYGEKCWELDALSPSVLDELITCNIDKLTDFSKLKKAQTQQKKDRETLRQIANNLTD